jgi:hypothetical protein
MGRKLMGRKSLPLSASRASAAAVLALLLLLFPFVWAEPIPATYRQGSLHGFLALKSQDGKTIAVGDQINTVHGVVVRSELIFRFPDGSIDDEVAVFRQGKTFALVSDRHIQKGLSFPQPLDLAIDAAKGEVTWRETKDGKSETKSQHMDLPADLANGLLPLAIESFPASAPEMKVSYLATDPNPRLVQLSIKREGEDKVEVGGIGRHAARFRMHIEIGGVAGAIAPLLGKEPSDVFFWATEDAMPVVIKTEGALYLKGPVWTALFTSPVWPQNPAGQ